MMAPSAGRNKGSRGQNGRAASCHGPLLLHLATCHGPILLRLGGLLAIERHRSCRHSLPGLGWSTGTAKPKNLISSNKMLQIRRRCCCSCRRIRSRSASGCHCVAFFSKKALKGVPEIQNNRPSIDSLQVLQGHQSSTPG